MAARSIVAAIAMIVPALFAGSASASAQASPVVQKSPATRQPTIMRVLVEDVSSHQEMFSMRADLRRLVVAQETYWRARKTYASDVSGLPMFQETPGVVVQIIRSRSDGWAARATYGEATGAARSCVVWVGDIPASERPTTDVERKSYPEAEASCDGDGYTSSAEWTSAGRSYMTYALARLVRSEMRFYAYHRRFSNDPSTLDPFIWDNDVSVTITTATPTGWAARATFAGSTGKSCVVWHGTLDPSEMPVTVGHVSPTVDSRVSCDGDR
jgi:hypothetical protein